MCKSLNGHIQAFTFLVANSNFRRNRHCIKANILFHQLYLFCQTNFYDLIIVNCLCSSRKDE